MTAVAYRELLLTLAALICLSLHGCAPAPGDPHLTENTVIQLVDWHITGLWVINCPVAWVRVTNYNAVPIKDVTFQYNTYTQDGHPLDEGTFTIEGEVPAGHTKSFIELYLGLVNLHSEKLSIRLSSVSAS